MKILMVCLGNICRSPLAEGILRSKISEKHSVDSAGTIANHVGEHPDHRSIKIANHHNIDISRLRARQIEKSDLEEFDHIYCMDLSNYENVLSLTGNEKQRKKVSLILEEIGDHSNAEVPDPYWGTLTDFENVYQMLDQACEQIAAKIEG